MDHSIYVFYVFTPATEGLRCLVMRQKESNNHDWRFTSLQMFHAHPPCWSRVLFVGRSCLQHVQQHVYLCRRWAATQTLSSVSAQPSTWHYMHDTTPRVQRFLQTAGGLLHLPPSSTLTEVQLPSGTWHPFQLERPLNRGSVWWTECGAGSVGSRGVYL